MRAKRWISSFGAAAVVAGGLAMVSAAPAVATGGLTLDKQAPAGVLLGDEIPYDLVAANAGPNPQYNVSFSDVLPLGFRYMAGSAPAWAGDPTTSINGTGQQVLVWRNVTDLQVNSDLTLSFVAERTGTVPDTLTPADLNSATVASQEDPRTVPAFNPDGTPKTGTFSQQATDDATTNRLPFVIEKSNDNSPEGELLRGVHKNRTTYTLKVRNNKVVPTEDIEVTDFIPADMEFLACGNIDNSATGFVEYTGAPRLGVPALTIDPCPAPTAVDTVSNPAGLPAGVYTKVTWNVGDLAAGGVAKIKYVAGIPMQPNTMTWSGQTPATNGPQAANLDNNNGTPTTRERISERAIENTVVGVGTFTGSPASTQTVTSTDSVQIEDLRMRKKADTKTFTPGGIVTFSFELETSEYVTAKDVVMTDNLPDGYCPLGATSYKPADPLCAGGVALPSVPYSTVARLPDNDWSVGFTGVSLPVNGSLEVSFPARMLPSYWDGFPTLTGDSFRDTVALNGTTTSIPDVAPTETGDASVRDDSRYTQTSNLPVIDKQMKPRAAPPDPAGGMTCDPTVAPDYQQSATIPKADRAFRKGDKICFKLQVKFPDIITKNAAVTDFVPVGTEFLPGSVQVLTGPNYVTAYEQDLSGPLIWKLGVLQGADRYVPQGQIFEVVFAVKVLQPAGADAPEITGNLMKMRTVNTAGKAESYRDEEKFELIPPPNLALAKGVRQTTAPDDSFDPPADNKPVQQGSTATFQVDLTNDGWPDIPGGDYSVRGVQIWDILPTGVACSAITDYRYIKPGLTTPQGLPVEVTRSCTTDGGGQNIIKWAFPSPDTANGFSVPVGQTLSVLYDMAIPDPSSVSTNYANTAYVRSYDAFTDIPDTVATYYPKNNVDPTVLPAQQDSPPLKDPSNVYIRDAEPGKSAETSVDESNNDVPNQATIGERITYTYSVKIPDGSTVYRGELSDTLPDGIDLVSVVNWGLNTLGNQPAGFTVDPFGKLTFPTPYRNDSGADQTFLVKVNAKVLQTAVACAADPCVVPPAPPLTTVQTKKTNTATFRSYPDAQSDEPIDKTKTHDVNIVQPNPQITKTVTPEQMTSADQELTVTLQIRNSGGTRPPLHDWQARDCLPAPFELVSGSVVTPIGVTQTTGGQGCLLFEGSTTTPSPPAAPTDPLRGGVTRTVSFKIKSSTSLPASQIYENEATLTGSSLAGTVDGERKYTTSGKDTWISPGLAITKVTTEDTATIGQRFTSKISVDFDKDLNYYSAKVVDTLPAGVNPASVDLVGITCKNADTTDCGITGPQSTSGQQVTWTFSDITSAPQKRTVTIEYTAVVADIADNKAGVDLKNSAQPYWSTTQGGDPTKTTGPASDTVKIVEPSLSIVKKVDDQKPGITATPGQPFTYTLKVSNATGDNVSTAWGVNVTDQLPADLVVVGAPSDSGAVAPDGRSVTWTIDSLAPGKDKTLSYTARLKPPATTNPQTNTAAVSEYYSLDNKQGRKYTGPSDTADVTPVLPVLTIAKDASAMLAYIDEPYTWTIVVTNTSGATAYGVDIADTLPPNWSYKTGSAQWVITGGTPAAKEPTGTPPNIAWNDIANLPTGKTLTITFQAVPGPDVVQSPGVGLGKEHTNTAQTTWTLGPAGQGWGTGTSEPDDAYTEIASADLMLEKTHRTAYPKAWNVAKGEVVPGTEFDWILKVTNNGPDTSVGPFVVKDTLPAGVKYKGYNNASDWSCNAVVQVVTCTIPGPTLAKNESLPDLVLTVGVDAGVTGKLKNTAEVTGKTYDPNPGNNKAEDEVTTRPLADLAIVKTRTQPYVVGNQVTYTLAVTNLGPSVSVKDINVEDTLPTGLSIASIDAGAWQCQPTSGETDKLTCVLAKDLAPNEQAPLIKVTVDVLESPGAEAVNTAKVTPTTEDQNLENNTSTVTDPVVSEVQLGIAKKTTGANPVTAGQSTEFTITVTNAGPAKAKNVKVVDQLEAGLKATSATGTGWTCDVGSGTIVTCTRANFPVSASPSDIVIKADVDKAVPGGTTLKNVATVTTTSPQPGGNPPPATSTVDVVAKSDLAITKTHDGGPWTIGKTGTWRVRVVNNGPSNNPGPITVVDNLPRGNEFLSATGDGWACSAASRAVTCIHAAGLVVGEESAFSIRVNVVDGAAPSVVNPAEVSSPIEDTDPSNNKATDQVPVERAKQTAEKLPPDPSVFPARTTEQGQKIRTKVRCRTLKSSTAGEVSYCKVRKSKNGTVRVKVVGSRPVKVIVTQFAKGTKNYKPFKRVKTYIVRP